MDFFDQAKKMVMQSVGLQDTITPDAEFEKWNEHLKRIDGMAVILRRHFNAYANTMVDMCHASASLTTEISNFYERSDSRKASVKKFVDAHADINSAVSHMFKEQFGWDLLALFDKWVDELAATRQRIRALDELRHNTLAQEAKVKALQQRRDPVAQSELKTAESQLSGLQANLEQGRTKMRELVKLQIDNRFGQFDAIFVRLMECQLDFFRSGAGVVSSFEPNIANYRKLHPLTSRPATDLDESFDQSEHIQDAEPPSPTAAAAATAAAAQKSRAVSGDDEDFGFPSVAVPKAEASGPASNKGKQPRSSAVDQSDILDFGGLMSGNQPAPVSSKSSKATSPTVAAQDEDFFGLSGSAGAAPKSTSGTAKKASTDNFDLFNLNTNGPSNPSRPAARPSPPSDDFSFDAAFTSSKPAQKAAPIPAPESEHKRKSSLTDFDNLFGTSKPAAPAAPVAPVAAPQASSAKGPLKNVDKWKEEERLKEAEAEARHTMGESIQSRVDNWALKSGVSKNLRTLILTLPEIVWPGCEWQPMTMNDLMDTAAVKRAHRKAMIVFHPDKVMSLSPDVRLTAEKIYDYLTKGWSAFQAQER